MRIVVTGGLGFIGSQVVHELFEQNPGCEILVIDKHNYAASIRNLRGVSHLTNFHLQCFDLTDEDKTHKTIAEFKPHIVFHLAAETHVDRSFGNSIAFTHSNVVGTHNLLEACRRFSIGEDGNLQTFLFVHMSTDEVYGAGDDLQGKESHCPKTSILLPTNPYAASKAAAEMQVHAYKKSFGMPSIIIRCNNVYGPRQFCEKVVPRFILQKLHGADCTIHGTGGQMRSFLHVQDAAKAIVFSARTLYPTAVHASSPIVINVGSAQELSIRDLARMIFGDKLRVVNVEDRKFNDFRYPVQVDMLRSLGWTETIELDEGLRQTIEWYRNFADEWFLPIDIQRAVHSDGHFSEREHTDRFGTEGGIMVVGSTGWIGPKVIAQLQKQQPGRQILESTFRLSDTKTMWAQIVESKPSHVVLSAGITGRPNIDWCESHPLETVAANLEGTVTLAQICNRLGIHFTNFATGCIYAGDITQTFDEDSPPNFFGSLYSRTKAHAENIQVNSYTKSTTLVYRLRMPIDVDIDHPRNLIAKLRNYSKLVNHPNSVSVLSELLPIACNLLLKKNIGVYNLTNPGHITPADIMKLFDQHFPDQAKPWVAVSPESLLESKSIVAARSNCVLDSNKLIRAAMNTRHHLPNSALIAVNNIFNAHKIHGPH